MCTGTMARVRSVIRLSIDSRVHRQRGRVGIGKHRQGFVHQNRVVRGDERVGRGDDFVAGVHAHDIQAGDQRGGAAGRGQTPPCTEQFRVGRLEIRHLLAAAGTGPLPAAQDLEHIRLPGLAPVRPLGPAAAVTGVPPSRAGLSASAANIAGARRALNQVNAAEPAAAVRTKARRVSLSFMARVPRR